MKTSGCLLQCLKRSCFAHGPLRACESLHTHSGSCDCRLHEQLGWLGSVLVHLCERPDFHKASPEAPWRAAQVAATVDDLVDAVACACGPELAAAEAGPAPAAAGGGDPSRGAGDATCSSLQALGRQRGSEDAGASADGEPDAGGAAGSGWGANARAAAQNGGGGHPPGGSGRSVGEAAAAGDGSGGGGGRPVAAPARSAAAQGPAASGACARAGLGSAFLDLDGRGGDPPRRWVLPSDEDEYANGGGGGGAPSAGAAAHPGSAGQTGGRAPGRPAPAGAAGPAPSAAEGAAGGDGPARGGPAEPAARPGADVPPPWQPVAATPAMELRRRREREADSSGKRGAPGGGGSVKVEPGVGHGRGGGGGGGRGHGAAQRPSAAPDVKPALGALSAEMRLQAPPAVGLRAKSAPLEPAAHRAPAPTWLSSVLLRAGGGRGMRGPGSRARRHQRRRTGGSRARGRRVRPGPKSDPFSSRAQAWRRSCAGA